jgi:hypothetical protein
MRLRKPIEFRTPHLERRTPHTKTPPGQSSAFPDTPRDLPARHADDLGRPRESVRTMADQRKRRSAPWRTKENVAPHHGGPKKTSVRAMADQRRQFLGASRHGSPRTDSRQPCLSSKADFSALRNAPRQQGAERGAPAVGPPCRGGSSSWTSKFPGPPIAPNKRADFSLCETPLNGMGRIAVRPRVGAHSIVDRGPERQRREEFRQGFAGVGCHWRQLWVASAIAARCSEPNQSSDGGDRPVVQPPR